MFTDTRTSIPIINTTDAPTNREPYPRRYRQPTARYMEGRNPVYRRFRHAPLGQAQQQPQPIGQEAREDDNEIELVEGDLDDNGNPEVLVEAGESTWLDFADDNTPVIGETDPESIPIMEESSVYWVRNARSSPLYRDNEVDETWKKVVKMTAYEMW